MKNPFEREEIRMKKVGLEELLDLIRSRTNRCWMPIGFGDATKDSARPIWNPYLEDITHFGARETTEEVFVDDLAAVGKSGYYRSDNFCKHDVFAVLYFSEGAPDGPNMCVVVNLKTLRTMITTWDTNGPSFFQWTTGQEVAIDRFALVQQLGCLA